MSLIINQKLGASGGLLIITDKEILGKTFTEKNLQLDLTLKFYQGEEKDVEEIKELIKKTRHLHFTGEEAVALGVSLDLINPKKILRIQGVPHAEVIVEANQ